MNRPWVAALCQASSRNRSNTLDKSIDGFYNGLWPVLRRIAGRVMRELQNDSADGRLGGWKNLGADLLSLRVLRSPVGESDGADLEWIGKISGTLKERMDQRGSSD